MFPCLRITSVRYFQLVLVIVSLYVVGNANAQAPETSQSCYPRVSYAIMLANTLGQIKQVSGIELRGNLMELYVSPKSGTWTLVLIVPPGLACKIGSGTKFNIESQPYKV